MSRQAPGIQAYQRQQLESMSPERLVLVVFEQGILACRKKDPLRARRVLEQLIGALDFSYGEVAGGFLVLYDWTLQLIREAKFEEAGRTFEQLRGAWASALRKEAGGREASPPGGADAGMRLRE